MPSRDSGSQLAAMKRQNDPKCFIENRRRAGLTIPATLRRHKNGDSSSQREFGSNGNKMSHHWRERAWRAGCKVGVMGNLGVCRPVVGSIAWLGPFLVLCVVVLGCFCLCFLKNVATEASLNFWLGNGVVAKRVSICFGIHNIACDPT